MKEEEEEKATKITEMPDNVQSTDQCVSMHVFVCVCVRGCAVARHRSTRTYKQRFIVSSLSKKKKKKKKSKTKKKH